MRLTEFMFPCITYVIRRTGLDVSPEEFASGERFDMRTFDAESAEPGDIVCWKNDDVRTDVTLEIRNGSPVTERITVNNHYGVYEGDGLVSDLTIDGDHYAPRVRVMDVRRGRVPEFIVSIKPLNKER